MKCLKFGSLKFEMAKVFPQYIWENLALQFFIIYHNCLTVITSSGNTVRSEAGFLQLMSGSIPADFILDS